MPINGNLAFFGCFWLQFSFFLTPGYEYAYPKRNFASTSNSGSPFVDLVSHFPFLTGVPGGSCSFTIYSIHSVCFWIWVDFDGFLSPRVDSSIRHRMWYLIWLRTWALIWEAGHEYDYRCGRMITNVDIGSNRPHWPTGLNGPIRLTRPNGPHWPGPMTTNVGRNMITNVRPIVSNVPFSRIPRYCYISLSVVFFISPPQRSIRQMTILSRYPEILETDGKFWKTFFRYF